MKRTTWLTLGLLMATAGPTNVATAGLWQQLLRWAGAGWGDGYHSQTNTTGHAPLPGTWQHRSPLGNCGVPGCPHCGASHIDGVIVDPNETVEVLPPRPEQRIERLPTVPGAPTPAPKLPDTVEPKSETSPRSTPSVPVDVL